MKTKILLLIIFSSIGILVRGQPKSGTIGVYKRISIVHNGKVTHTNDDAHYITFTKNGCYSSDAAGNTLGYNPMQYVKTEKNLYCYSTLLNNVKAQVYFSSDFSRINVRHGDYVDGFPNVYRM